MPVVLEELKSDLIQQIRFYAFLIYALKLRTGDWGILGKDQIQMSFCRQLLALRPDVVVTGEILSQFELIVDEGIKEFGFDSWDISRLKTEIEALSITFQGVEYDIHHVMNINPVLRDLGADFTIQGGAYGDEKELIIGEGDIEDIEGYHVVRIRKELMRTPNVIVSMAAAIGYQSVFVRYDALETIFYYKWYSFAEMVFSPAFSMINWPVSHRISTWIKEKTFDAYNVHTLMDIAAVKEIFIQDLSENVLNHELGHGIIQHHYLPEQPAAFGEAMKVFGETIITTMLEIFAESAPRKGGLKGPLLAMCETSSQDMVKANRQFWMYLSDVWFFDTAETFMFDFSDGIVLVMSQFIREDGSVDFDGLSLCFDDNNSSFLYEMKMFYLTVMDELMAAVGVDCCSGETYEDVVNSWTTTLETLAQDADIKSDVALILDQVRVRYFEVIFRYFEPDFDGEFSNELLHQRIESKLLSVFDS